MQLQLPLALLRDHGESFRQQLLGAYGLLLLPHQPDEHVHEVLQAAVQLRGVHDVRYQDELQRRALHHFDDDASRAGQQDVLLLKLYAFQQGPTANQSRQALLRSSDDEHQLRDEQQSQLRDVAQYHLCVASRIVPARANRQLERQDLCDATQGGQT